MPDTYNDVMQIGTGGPTTAEKLFRATLTSVALGGGSARVLELGTRRWVADFPTHHAAWAPHGVEWVKSDMQEGADVDVVADAHDLAGTFRPIALAQNLAPFDAYVAVSVYEHLRRPWVAARAAAEVLKPGGLAYVATHQTFPLHGFPQDYFRFSREGLASIFEDAGFAVLSAGYAYPAAIQPGPEVVRWNPGAEAYLNVDLVARLPE